MDDGDDYVTLKKYLIPWMEHIKMVRIVNFVLLQKIWNKNFKIKNTTNVQRDLHIKARFSVQKQAMAD